MDIYVAKLDVNGDHLWSKRFGNALYQYGTTTATDGAGNVLLTGVFQGAVDFGGGPLTSAGDVDIYLAKLDANGNHLWSKRFGDPEYQSAITIATDSAGNVFLAGLVVGIVDFGGGPIENAENFVAKLDADGNHLWSTSLGAHAMGATKFGIDDAGNVLFAGILEGDALAVAKLDADGNHVWYKVFESESQHVIGIAIDSAGDVLITGYFRYTVDFGSGPLMSAGGADIYLAKLDANGNHVWSKRFGDSDDQYPSRIAVDGAGNVLIVGDFLGTVNFGGITLTAGSATFPEDTFVAKLDASGNHLWSRRFVGEMKGIAPALDDSGNALLAGSFLDPVDLGNGPLVSSSTYDIFLAKFSP
jgi:hypothetical protein